MTQTAPRFIHLRVRSALTLLQSMIRPKDLAKWAVETGAPAVCVTDDNLFAALELSEALTAAGVQSITGLTLNVSEPGITGESGTLALIAQNETGYLNLMALSSASFLEPAGDARQVALATVLDHADGLICLTGGYGGLLNRRAAAGRRDEVHARLQELHAALGDRLYVELQRHGRREEAAAEEVLVDLAYELGLPLVATNDARFKTSDQYETHDVLLCIANSAYVSQTDRPRVTQQHYLKSQDEMAAAFADLPEAIANTVEIAHRCAFRPLGRAPILPTFDTKRGRDEAAELTAQAKAGLKERLAGGELHAERKVYEDRLAYELAVIEKMGFPGYFLIVSDFIKWAKSNDIPVGPGRGSGAGSVVAWALTITDLDPLRFGLLFERFLNPERVSMPDFDVDFCQERRGEVIEYVRQKYGADRVAQIITFGTLQARAVLRDVGRVLQLPFGQVDKLAKLVPFNPAQPPTLAEALEMEPRLQEAMEAEEAVAHLVQTAQQLEGLYRNASTHAAGVVMVDRPLQELTPLYRDPKSDMPATQFNMKWAEAAGLVKFDFLGLKTLTVIQRALGFIEKEGRVLGDAWTTYDDPKSYELMASGNTLGVFQLEGQGMRDTLRKVQPNCIDDIIALISLYRPGPMKNIDTYVDAKFGRKDPDYLHEDLKPVLEETHGVIVYQEQVMNIARILAGYSLGEADLLRRAMGKKKPEEMAKQKQRFLDGAVKKGVTSGRAEYIFELVNEFAGYGFNKSHAAAYAVIAYQTAFLKANHPVEFLAASMSLDIHNTDKLAAFFQDARRMNVKIALPDVSTSNADFDVRDQTICYALGAIKGVGKPAMLSVEQARANGPFQDLQDFSERVDARLVNRRCFEALARAGAFQSLEPNRARAFAAASALSALAATAEEERNSNQVNLFGDEPMARARLPSAAPWSEADRLDHELGAVGFFLSGHPLDDLLTGDLRERIVLAADRETAGRERLSFDVIGVVRARVEKPARSGGKFAFVTLSDPSGEFEVTVPPETLDTSRELLDVGKRVMARVKVRRVDDDVRFSIESVRPLSEASIGSHEALCVRVNAEARLDQLASIAQGLRRTRSTSQGSILIEIPLEDNRVVMIALDGVYPVDFGAMSAFKAAPGVDQVRPAAA
ncbi:MAG: DNA polymerase III subunit alpha [Alphaproteobacteria bacterium]|nr:DNA polymerase III subunit alpha [Alphaproteobacteria bacterium]